MGAGRDEAAHSTCGSTRESGGAVTSGGLFVIASRAVFSPIQSSPNAQTPGAMVSGRGNGQVVTAVMENGGKTLKKKGSGGGRQDDAELAKSGSLLVGHDQKFESAAQAVTVADDGAQLDDIGSKREGKLERNNFTGLQLSAEGCSDAVLADFIGAAPVG